MRNLERPRQPNTVEKDVDPSERMDQFVSQNANRPREEKEALFKKVEREQLKRDFLRTIQDKPEMPERALSAEEQRALGEHFESMMNAMDAAYAVIKTEYDFKSPQMSRDQKAAALGKAIAAIVAMTDIESISSGKVVDPSVFNNDNVRVAIERCRRKMASVINDMNQDPRLRALNAQFGSDVNASEVERDNGRQDLESVNQERGEQPRLVDQKIIGFAERAVEEYRSEKDSPYAEGLLHARLRMAGIDVKASQDAGALGDDPDVAKMVPMTGSSAARIINIIVGVIEYNLIRYEMKEEEQRQAKAASEKNRTPPSDR